MDLHLSGKKAVVTGGSKGIGLAIVRLLAEEGMEVVSASRTVTPELKETGAVPMVVDLSTEHGPVELIDRAIAALGGIDLLVNNVGIGDTEDIIQGARHSVLDLPDSAWKRAFDLHFYSALRVTRAALPSLVITKGTVISISSVSARLVGAGPVDYNVSKAALNALTKVFAEQFGAQGVRAITVAPGPVSTGVWTDPDGLIARLARDQGVPHQEFADGLLRSLGPASGRMTRPEEVARLVAFLASPSNITGVEYSIDGGIIKQL